MQSASIFQWDDSIFIHPESQTTDGVWVNSAPLFRVAATAPPIEIVGSLKKALNASRQKIPHPEDWKTVPNLLREALGQREWKDFRRAATHCAVTREDSVLRFEPTRNDYPEDGFSYLEGQAFRVPEYATETDLMNSIRNALRLCIPAA